MRAPEQRWEPEHAVAHSQPTVGHRDIHLSSLLDRARDSLMPLSEYLDGQVPSSRAVAAAAGSFAQQNTAAPLPVAGPAQGDFDHWRPPMQHGAAADALKLQSADAALLAGASRRANPHGASAAASQHAQAQPFGRSQSPVTAEYGRPHSRSKVLDDVVSPWRVRCSLTNGSHFNSLAI